MCDQQKAPGRLEGAGASYNVADAEAGDDFAVAVDVFVGNVGEEPATATHHLEKASARVVIVLVGRKVPSKLVDAGGQDRYLYFGRACIGLM